MICNNCKGSCTPTLPGQRQCIECLRAAVRAEPTRMDRFTAGVLFGMLFEAAAIVLYLLVAHA